MLPRGDAALAELRQILYDSHEVGPAGGLPSVATPCHQPIDPDPWLWGTQETGVPPLTSAEAYALGDLANGQGDVHHPPAALRQTDAFADYARQSVDVTMRGGTTSGVVYPLAICEIARTFRLRNVGGASAGAIAASCAAAAEVGRTRWDLKGRPSIDPRPDPAAGNLRQGFAGLADAVAWYCQLDAPEASDQRRIAQLFQPTDAGHRLFRLFIATMQERRKVLRVALLAVGAFGRVSKVVTWAVLGAVILWFWWHRELMPEQASTHVWSVVAAVAWTVGLALVAVGLGVLAASGRPAETGPAEPVPTEPPAPPGRGVPPLAWGLAMTAIVVLLLVCGGGEGRWRFLALSLLVWATAVLVLVVSNVAAIARIALVAAKDHGFGLVAGTGRWRPTWWGHLWNRVAGMPHGSSAPPLIKWLDRSLSQLAGQEGPLLFADLWQPAPEIGDAQKSTTEIGWRSVNLELVTTELVHGVPHRFPPTEDPGLWLRAADLERTDPSTAMFPPRIIKLLQAGDTLTGVRDIETGEDLGTLHRLPPGGQLPVIVAVRLSMSLPGLFEAIRFYRVVTPSGSEARVRDEYGREVVRDGSGPVHYPGDTSVSWAEELWFTDGGVAQNFPIHLFDSVLPSWPTLGINLGGYPRGHRHQDVWAPDDRGSRSSPPTPLTRSVASFFGSIVSTARGWSDTKQTFMPAMRGRVAWVRQSPTEGGTNLLMNRETIAALALRGALAGQRLARRHASAAHWRRHQWLRLRVAATNLAELERSLDRANAAGDYVQRLSEASLEPWRQALDEVGGDPTSPEQLEWWPPRDHRFWEEVSDLVHGIPQGEPTFTDGGPSPSPELRQVPGS